MTGTPTASRKRRARSLKTPSGSSSPGTKYAVDSRVAPVPPLTLSRSIAPVDARLRATSISSSGPSPPVRHWSTAIRKPTMKSSETAARTASSTSRPKRVRFSRLPPYSSVRVLTPGSKNCSIRCPPNEVTSQPSQPQRSRRAAASANRCTIAGISDDGQRHRHLEVDALRKVGRRAQRDARQRRRAAPPHVGHLRHAQRAVAWTPSASARSAGSLRSSQSEIEPYDAAVVGSTDAEPNVMTSPHAAGRLADVVVHLARIDQTVAAPPRRVRRRHDPVAQHLAAQLQRRVEVREGLTAPSP